ncbi:GNAT family N-acetyltransferase, partial [Paenibacillus sp. MCAF20]
MNEDEEVMEYFPNTLNVEETKAFYDRILDEFKEFGFGGFGLYAVEEKDTNRFIGFHRAAFEADFTPCVEIGWRLNKEAWGKGYASEGARACLLYGLDSLGFDEVFSFTADINEPSKKVMKKLSLSFVKTFDHPNVGSSSPLCKHVLHV